MNDISANNVAADDLRLPINWGSPEFNQMILHLKGQFGGFQVCPVCEVYLPPENSLVEITETLVEPDGMGRTDEDYRLKPGRYLIGTFDNGLDNASNHFTLMDEEGEILYMNAGYMLSNNIDWRHSRRAPTSTDHLPSPFDKDSLFYVPA